MRTHRSSAGIRVWAGCFIIMSAAAAVRAADLPAPIKLEAPDMTRGRPLMQVLKDRQSRRAFDSRPVTLRDQSDLFWAAFGVNRPDDGRRTAPSAVNWREIDIYAALPSGLYLYDAVEHRLDPVLSEDIRPMAGRQRFVQEAPMVLIYVADLARMTRGAETDKAFYSAVDTGLISQNVYMFCASENLATVVIGMVDKPALAKAMGLRPEQRVLLTQPVGYPAE